MNSETLLEDPPNSPRAPNQTTLKRQADPQASMPLFAMALESLRRSGFRVVALRGDKRSATLNA